jgi:hypothetical protein
MSKIFCQKVQTISVTRLGAFLDRVCGADQSACLTSRNLAKRGVGSGVKRSAFWGFRIDGFHSQPHQCHGMHEWGDQGFHGFFGGFG